MNEQISTVGKIEQLTNNGIDEVCQVDRLVSCDKHEWRCFHCGELFTNRGDAADHFGVTQDTKPGCMVKVEMGGERGLLMSLRSAETKIARYMAEDDTDVMRAMYRMQSEHSEALRQSEDAGYARGLADRIRANYETKKLAEQSN